MTSDTMEYEGIIREFIGRCEWRWARTYVSVPHEYIVRGKCPLNDDEFVYFINAQRKYGVLEYFYGRPNKYLHIDGYKYWTMGAPIPDTIIMNRQKLFDEFDSIDVEDYYSNEELSYISNRVSELGKKFFEIGTGIGNFIRQGIVNANDYCGCEPSKNAVAKIKELYPEFSRNITAMSFEQTIEKIQDDDYVFIGLFGSPSYVMKPYLKILAERSNPYFLMFYKEGYIPEYAKSMHSFNYPKEELQQIFGVDIEEYGNYYVLVKKVL